MSRKITSKNLSYSSQLPPFLAALHAQAAGASGPDPLAAAQRRSARKRTSSEEAEDAPLVVDELGIAVSVHVDKDGVVRDAAGDAESKGADSEGEHQRPEAAAKSAIGGRKRKAGKVVGDAADDAVNRDAADALKRPEAPADQKAKKKAKKIKLCFDEDQD